MRSNKPKFSMKKIFCALLFLFLVVLVISNISHAPNKFGITKTSNQPSFENSTQQEEQKDTTISMAVVGDIMCHGPNYKDAFNASTKTYDFSTFFPQIKSYISNADIAVGNLETTFAGGNKAYSGYPTFNSPPQLAKDVQDLGIDVLTTSNNHSMDSGYNGLINTINTLDNLGISHTGTFKSEEDKNKILIKDVNGVKIAFLSYTYGTNGISIPKGKEYCINLIDKDLIKKQLESAKAQNPDVICVSMHWGIEYKLQPNTEQKDLADYLFENGADIILGSHPHVLEPMEKRTVTLSDGTKKDGFVIYSLGNFISAQKDKYTKDSIILNLKITKHSQGNINIDSYDYTPIYMQDNGANATNRYELVDLEKKIKDYENGDKSITATAYKTYIAELKNVKTALGEDKQ